MGGLLHAHGWWEGEGGGAAGQGVACRTITRASPWRIQLASRLTSGSFFHVSDSAEKFSGESFLTISSKTAVLSTTSEAVPGLTGGRGGASGRAAAELLLSAAGAAGAAAANIVGGATGGAAKLLPEGRIGADVP